MLEYFGGIFWWNVMMECYDFKVMMKEKLWSWCVKRFERKYYAEIEEDEEGKERLISFCVTAIVQKTSFDLKQVEVYTQNDQFQSVIAHLNHQIHHANAHFSQSLRAPPVFNLWFSADFEEPSQLLFSRLSSDLLVHFGSAFINLPIKWTIFPFDHHWILRNRKKILTRESGILVD